MQASQPRYQGPPLLVPLFRSVGQVVEEPLNRGVPSVEVTNTKIMRTFFGVP